MGWLLTFVLALPQQGVVEFAMWFSQESYCAFAIEKFGEQPYQIRLSDGQSVFGKASDLKCRELDAKELHLVPQHLRYKALNQHNLHQIPLSGP